MLFVTDENMIFENLIEGLADKFGFNVSNNPDTNQVSIAFFQSQLPASKKIQGFQLDQRFYAASIVKLYFLVYACQQLSDCKIQMELELERALTDMIVDSSNDATALVVDILTDTTGGPNLNQAKLAKWMRKRSVITQYFRHLGYLSTVAEQKTWNEGPYGRELQSRGPEGKIRNLITASETLRCLIDLKNENFPYSSTKHGREWNDWAIKLLRRQIENSNDSQVIDFSGLSMPAGTEFYSKAGWTSEVRHDVCFASLPDGKEVAFAILTQGISESSGVIPEIANIILKSLV